MDLQRKPRMGRVAHSAQTRLTRRYDPRCGLQPARAAPRPRDPTRCGPPTLGRRQRLFEPIDGVVTGDRQAPQPAIDRQGNQFAEGPIALRQVRLTIPFRPKRSVGSSLKRPTRGLACAREDVADSRKVQAGQRRGVRDP